MDVTLTPEMEAIVRHHIASGIGPSPEAVLVRALYQLEEMEIMEETPAIKPDWESSVEFADPRQLPLLKQLHETEGPRFGLKKLRQRLAEKIPGSMAQTVREDRNDRV